VIRTWSFALTVKGAKLTQVAPTTGTTTIGKAFPGQLEVSGSHGTVTYAQTEADVQILTVSSSGAVSAPTFSRRDLQDHRYRERQPW